MAKRKKQKVVLDKEKSEYYGSDRKPLGKKDQVFRDKTKYTRKDKHRKDLMK